MGCRLHVAKTYIVKYSDYEEINWQQEEFRNLMDALEIPVAGGTLRLPRKTGRKEWKLWQLMKTTKKSPWLWNPWERLRKKCLESWKPT